jgi:Reverse transcriptase (RNA-dependent DNA polymerase)
MIHTGTANIDNDCLYYGQAMKANNCNDFCKAMPVKLKANIDQRHWVKILRTSLPKDMKPIKTVWSFKRKLLSITEDLWAWQIDFILAYPQADIKTGIYLDLPIGYKEFLDPNEHREYCVLLLKTNVCCLKQAGRTWFQHLRSRLVDLGFTQNTHNHCMFSNRQTVPFDSC